MAKPTDDGFGSLFDPIPSAVESVQCPTLGAASAGAVIQAAPRPSADVVVNGLVQLQEDVEYRTLFLWSRAYDALIANRAICQDFAPAYMGDVLVLQEEGLAGSNLGNYTLLAELVAVKDECRGEVRRYIWKFDNLRPVQPRPGKRQPKLGRVVFVGSAEMHVREVP